MWAEGVVGFCLIYIAWVIAGYPLWLKWRADRRTEPLPAGTYVPSITAVIPVHNGGSFLAAKLDSVLGSRWDPERLDVLVLSDGSTDDTDRIAESYEASGRVRLMRLPRGGKSSALNEAMKRVTSEVLLLTDVRQRLDPDCVAKLAARLRDSRVGVVSGNLRILTSNSAAESNVGLYWRYESWIRCNLSRCDSLVGATGPIYAIRRELASPLPPDCLLDDVWLPMQAVLRGFRSVWEEGAIAWDYPTALETEFNRKVRTQAGIYQILRQEPRLLRSTNRLRWPFICLKVGRLLLPHVMLVMLAASFWLSGWLKVCFLGGQLGFYGLAALDLTIPDGSAMKKFTGPARAVLTLLAAAFCAQAVFFIEPRRLWKVTYAKK